MTPPLTLRQQAVALKPREMERLSKETAVSSYTKGLSWELPFFKTPVWVIELTDDAHQPIRRDYYIKDGSGITPASYSADFVESLASSHGLDLSRDTVEDYIRFYLAFTRGGAGRVLPVNIIDELPLREELSLIIRRKLQSLITPMIVEDIHQVTGCFLIGNKLVKAKLTIDPKTGKVDMEALNLLADTLPVSDSLLEA